MERRRLSRRDILQGAATLATGAVFASPVRAQAPEPVAI
jgi:iron(III) transport system substrate-binding protein